MKEGDFVFNKTLSSQNIENFNYEETKKNVSEYFRYLEKLQWELAKLNAQKGLVANYDFANGYQKQPYIPIGKDTFNISARGYTEDQLKDYIATYYWAKNLLADKEQLYIKEYFINNKYEDELVDMLGVGSSDSNEFRQLKRSAIYKLADFLNLLTELEKGDKK